MNLLKDHAPRLWKRFEGLKQINWNPPYQKRFGDLNRMIKNKHRKHFISFGHIRKEIEFFEGLNNPDERGD